MKTDMKKEYSKPFTSIEDLEIITNLCEASGPREEDLSGQGEDDEPAGAKYFTDWYSGHKY